MMLATVIRGLSDAKGSWKMICMSRQAARNAALSMAVTSRSSNQTWPLVGSIKRRMHRPVVDFPHPDSPTTPSVSPACNSKLTPSTACTLSTTRLSTPPRIGKCFTNCFTRSKGLAVLCVVIIHLTIQKTSHLVTVFDWLEQRVCVDA